MIDSAKDLREVRWFKKGSGTVAGTARRVLRTTVPDPFLNLDTVNVEFARSRSVVNRNLPC